MTGDKSLPLRFKKCPICGSSETVCGVAFKEEIAQGKVDAEFPGSLEQRVIPKFTPGKVAGVTVDVIVRHYDNCAECGFEYCTKVEIVKAPIKMAPKGSGFGAPPGGFPGGFQGFPGFGQSSKQ